MSWIPKFVINRVKQDVLKSASDSDIHLEAATRSTSSNKGKSAEIHRSNSLFVVKTLSDWNNAVASATDPDNPSFVLLSELYDSMKLDNHLVSTIENRIYKVLQSKFMIKTASGEENPDLKTLFQSVWFEDFVKYAMWSKFTGVKVLEIFDVDDNLELNRTTNIPMAHILPSKGIFSKEEGEEHGWKYKEGGLARFYVQVGEDTDIGLFKDIAPMVLAKKLAMGSWLDFVEKFGIPARYVTTDREDKQRLDELFDMMLAMVNNHVAVLRGAEKIEIANTPNTDAHQVFNELISRINSEMAKRILGQDGTSDHKEASGTFGSLKVLQEVAEDRHESDKMFIKNLINKELIPRLTLLSSFYTGVTGHTFDWDNSEEMSTNEFIDNVVKLTDSGYELDTDQIQERTGLTIKGKKETEPIEPTAGSKKKAQK